MGSSLLNTHGISKRVIYSESMKKNATAWHRKIPNDSLFLVPFFKNQTLMGSSSLNMRCVFIKVTYSESGKHILQLGSENFDF